MRRDYGGDALRGSDIVRHSLKGEKTDWVGVSLVPTIVSSINTAKNTPNAPTGLSGLLDVLAYVFVAVILLGAVAWIGGQG